MTKTVQEQFWQMVEDGSADAGEMTKKDAFNCVLRAFDALLLIISERNARIAELEAALRLMTDIFRPRQGEPDGDMYVETIAHNNAMSLLPKEANDE